MPTTPPSSGRTPPRRRWSRRWDLIGAAVLLVAGLGWVALRPGIARSVIGSQQALAILTGGLLAGVAAGWVIWRRSRRPLVSRAVALLPLLAVFLWSEVLPMIAGPVTSADADPISAVASPATTGRAPAGAPITVAPPSPSPSPARSTPTPTPTPDSSTPAGRSSSFAAPSRRPAPTSNRAAGTPAPSTTRAPTATTAPTPPPIPPLTPPPAAAVPAAPTGPRLLGTGPLVGIDHEASGTVEVIEVDGATVVRFEDFSVELGPDYLLHVVPGAGATSPGGQSLGPLQATRGDLNVPVANVSGVVTVLIWCRAYAVPVAAATIHLAGEVPSERDAS